MTQQHYIEEYHEALDTRSVLDAFGPSDVNPPEESRQARPPAQSPPPGRRRGPESGEFMVS